MPPCVCVCECACVVCIYRRSVTWKRHPAKQSADKRIDEQERRTKRPNKRIFFLLSHCTFIKRFIIFQAFSDSLRPICATQKQHTGTSMHRHAIHRHRHAQSARMNILFYFFEWRGQLLWICYVYMCVCHIYIACVNIWMNNGTYQRPPHLPTHPQSSPHCIYELRKELKLLFWRVLLRSSSRFWRLFVCNGYVALSGIIEPLIIYAAHPLQVCTRLKQKSRTDLLD